MTSAQGGREILDMTNSPYSLRGGLSTDIDIDENKDTSQAEIRTEWIGTSQFFTTENIDLQKNGHLQEMIEYRKSLTNKLVKEPYNPAHYIELCRCDTKLGFSDIATANAHRAIILIKVALGQKSKHYDAEKFLIPVQSTVCNAVGTRSPAVIHEELRHIYMKAYRELLAGLLDTAAFWDGLMEGNKATKDNMFPNDKELLETYQLLKTGFINRHKDLKKQDAEGKELVIKSRMGKVCCKRYPWLAEELHFRTPDLFSKLNETLGSSCNIKMVAFDPSKTTSAVITEGLEDLGPLGLFATRDITENEVILVDPTFSGISNVSSSQMDHCDACHASLVFPFSMELKDIRKPSCCGKVAFCSKGCYETASTGYHSILCGHNFEWLYKGIDETSQMFTRWKPIMFCRIISIIIADRQATPEGQKPVHPLQHPLMAVMTANYAPRDRLQPKHTIDWQYFEAVQAPTRILLQLGIDIFADPDFSPEVVQTIYHRMENNSNMSYFNPKFVTEGFTIPNPSLDPLKSYDPADETPHAESTVHMYCLNTSYLFLNHSCDPNLNWHGCCPSPDDDIEDYRGTDGKMVKIGSSTVMCKAARDIKKGEELKISYIGDPLCKQGGSEVPEKVRELRRAAKRLWMTKWFEGGCGCVHCERENAGGFADVKRNEISDSAVEAVEAIQGLSV